MTFDTLTTISCPSCGLQSTELMPADTYVTSIECKACKTVLHAKPEHDCVFCSYGDIPCPPVQARRAESAREGTCCGACGG